MEKQLYLSSSPHIHSGETTDQVMRAVIYALLPACAVSVYFFGLPALLVLAPVHRRLRRRPRPVLQAAWGGR